MAIDFSNAPNPEDLLDNINEQCETGESAGDPFDQYLPVVDELRLKGMSWRDIAKAFSANGLKVSHAFIYAKVMEAHGEPHDYAMHLEEIKNDKLIPDMSLEDELKQDYGYDPDA